MKGDPEGCAQQLEEMGKRPAEVEGESTRQLSGDGPLGQ